MVRVSARKIIPLVFTLTILAAGTCWWLWQSPATSQPQIAEAPVPSETPKTSFPAGPLRSFHPDKPLRVRIPKLSIDSPLGAVGLTPEGEMQAPAKKDEIVWYKLGYLPGSLGNAVIAGHKWHVDGRGVFYNLDQLSPNDEIQIETADHTLFFKVTSQKSYPSDTPLREQIFGSSKKANLNLITCAGTWSATEKSYPNRLVVFSEFTRELALAR